MGKPDSLLLDFIRKVRSWISWGASDITCLSSEFQMPDNNRKVCCGCDRSFTQFGDRYQCRSCSRILCERCLQDYGYDNVVESDGMNSDVEAANCMNSCKFCAEINVRGEKFHPSPSSSPRDSPEPPSPCFSGESELVHSDHLALYLQSRDDDYSPHARTSSSVISSSSYPSPVSVCHSPSWNKEAENSGTSYFSSSSKLYYDTSIIDSNSISARHEFYSSKSEGSSPYDSPLRINFRHHVQKGQDGSPIYHNADSFHHDSKAVFRKPEKGTDDPEKYKDHSDDSSVSRNQNENSIKPLNFENNGLMWFPPPPDDEDAEADGNFFQYDDEDDEIGDSGALFSSSSSLSSIFPSKEKRVEGNKEPLRAAIQGHFRALVSQLLQAEGIRVSNGNSVENWLDIVTTIAWQAANFVKPNTKRGGSMDPGDYVKVKCTASGIPSESTLIKGVVCTKNIKHKRMISQYKAPKLLLLGGALEYQRVPNQLASFNTLLQQENDHLKMIISKIESFRPNVLLVERSVSSYAQEYLLAREISLVLNVKRPLLERIARCTGAVIIPSIDNLSRVQPGQCELFRLEKVVEEHEPPNRFNKKPSKTLMFFEGCPRRLGCTVLLRGTCREELKKIKHVVQYATFAAYHLSLETSFLADEGASLPKTTLKPSIAIPQRITADKFISLIPDSVSPTYSSEHRGSELYLEHLDPGHISPSSPSFMDFQIGSVLSDVYDDDLVSNVGTQSLSLALKEDLKGTTELPSEITIMGHPSDTHQSILVSFSSHCVLKGTVCERSRLLRIKFYGCFDKPLGRYLRDDLFGQTSCCRCSEPAEAHVQCYTHQQGNLTINVRRFSSLKLAGEQDEKIWMWHRCLRCTHIDGVPPATRRVVMSDAAWGLSFGKFLELSFSNHATANRVAPCGHSLQRDCLRYYGFGNMVAFFRYSPIDIFSVQLPLSVLEFNGHVQHEWMRKEVAEFMGKMETLYAEISDVLESVEQKSISFGNEVSDMTELHNHIVELKNLVKREKNDYKELLQPTVMETSQLGEKAVDILELNRLRRSLLVSSRVWDRRLYSLDSLLKAKPLSTSRHHNKEEMHLDGENFVKFIHTDSVPLHASSLSEILDSAWSGSDQLQVKALPLNMSRADAFYSGSVKQINESDNPPFRRLMSPARVHSFDSALRFQDRISKGLPPSSLHLSKVRSFHASGEYRSMVRYPFSNTMRTYSATSLISSASHLAEGARLLLPQTGHSNIVIAVYENEPTSIIAYALKTKEYEDWVAVDSSASNCSALQSFGSLYIDYVHDGSNRAEDASASVSTLLMDPKRSPHVRISFEDESSTAGGKVKFSVTSYFAKQFDTLRKKCCRSEVDFVRSLSRCKRWSAQGGKSNVYFAKSLDERFIIKQVTKTELESFVDFAPSYFNYMTESLSSGSPICLAKVLGIYQVGVKHLKGGKEIKMDIMVMENLFFNRNISRVYDLKGSARSRYNPNTTGKNNVLLDMNLLETLRTEPIFLGFKAKRCLERAIWNDTSFLASVDVMDYSLLVGVDEERKELVLGIIDFMRQYTWDKHLETWVKASGILGGPKNASPTIISPKQYKKRFRKAMTTYFLTVPDQWNL